MNPLPLILHAGATRVQEEELKTFQTPEATGTWSPLPHHDFVRLVRESLEADGITVKEAAHGITPDGARYFGVLGIHRVQDENNELSWMVGLRNSHDKSISARMALGSRVLVCDNMAFNGEIQIARKHTSRLHDSLPGLVYSAVHRMQASMTGLAARHERYKQFSVTDMQAHHIMVEAVRKNLVPNAMLCKVAKEWHEPQFPDFEQRTGWSLFNAFTTVMRESSTELVAQRTPKIYGLMDTLVG